MLCAVAAHKRYPLQLLLAGVGPLAAYAPLHSMRAVYMCLIELLKPSAEAGGGQSHRDLTRGDEIS